MAKEQFDITGMTCSACASRIEKSVSKLDGVQEVSVNLLKNSMSVSFDEKVMNNDQIIKKVTDIGYTVVMHKQNAKKLKTDNEKPIDLAAAEMQHMKKRLIVSLAFTIPLFYIAMGHMLKWPMPAFLVGIPNSMIFAFTQFLLVIPVMIAGGRFFRVGFKNLIKLSPNMDSLIALGSGAAFTYGIYAIYKIAWGFAYNNMDMVHQFSKDLYFESAAMILALITLGKYFEARAKRRTSDDITKLMNLAPKTALVLRNGTEQEIPIDDVISGDVLIVKAGDGVPVDGVVIEGASSIDESAITGESLPVEKHVGDKVTGGTINKTGYFKMEATAVGENTTLAKIIQLVDEATSSKAPIAKLADKISGVFVPIVILIAVGAGITWMLTGHSFEFALSITTL